MSSHSREGRSAKKFDFEDQRTHERRDRRQSEGRGGFEDRPRTNMYWSSSWSDTSGNHTMSHHSSESYAYIRTRDSRPIEGGRPQERQQEEWSGWTDSDWQKYNSRQYDQRHRQEEEEFTFVDEDDRKSNSSYGSKRVASTSSNNRRARKSPRSSKSNSSAWTAWPEAKAKEEQEAKAKAPVPELTKEELEESDKAKTAMDKIFKKHGVQAPEDTSSEAAKSEPADSEIAAAEEVRARSVDNESDYKTGVSPGMHATLMQRLAEMELKNAELQEKLKKVQPAEERKSRSPPQQKHTAVKSGPPKKPMKHGWMLPSHAERLLIEEKRKKYPGDIDEEGIVVPPPPDNTPPGSTTVVDSGCYPVPGPRTVVGLATSSGLCLMTAAAVDPKDREVPPVSLGDPPPKPAMVIGLNPSRPPGLRSPGSESSASEVSAQPVVGLRPPTLDKNSRMCVSECGSEKTTSNAASTTAKGTGPLCGEPDGNSGKKPAEEQVKSEPKGEIKNNLKRGELRLVRKVTVPKLQKQLSEAEKRAEWHANRLKASPENIELGRKALEKF